jgi:hypothetical protein
MHPIMTLTQRTLCAIITLTYAPAMMAANDWFPKVPAADDMSTGGKSAMTITSNYVKQGMSLILFIVSVGMFVKFISTVSHGIEEAKKSEGGSLAVFGTFTVMAIVYLAISIATGYLGYTIITRFQL